MVDDAFLEHLRSLKPVFPPGYTGDDFEFEALLSAYPDSRATLAVKLGVGVDQLNAFLGGRTDAISFEAIAALRRHLRIERDPLGGDCSWANGPYVFVSDRIDRLVESYNAASHGGDLDFAVELRIPASALSTSASKGQAHPHVVAFRACGSLLSLMLVPGEGRSLSKETIGRFINLWPRPVPVKRDVYDTFVRCAVFSLEAPVEARDMMLWLLQKCYAKTIDRREADHSSFSVYDERRACGID